MSANTAEDHAANMNRAANELLREVVAMVIAKSPPGTSAGSIIANISINMLTTVSRLGDAMVKLIIENIEKSGASVDLIFPKRPVGGESNT
jgi:hypothetical protein